MVEYPLNILSSVENNYLTSVLADGVFPELAGIWSLIDAAWDECQCQSDIMDDRINRFYAHPVWLLNGLFIEQHAESLSYRYSISEYVASLRPKRVADFGGGFGTLARMIGERCPDSDIHIIEPHPHALAIALANITPNVSFTNKLKGEYDVLVATDVFEHVPDPLSLVELTASHLRLEGQYLIANCFFPVIRCHLPSTFHFRWSWDFAMEAMNLKPDSIVAYGRSYIRTGSVLSKSAREIEKRSKRWFPLVERIPPHIRRRCASLLLKGAF